MMQGRRAHACASFIASLSAVSGAAVGGSNSICPRGLRKVTRWLLSGSCHQFCSLSVVCFRCAGYTRKRAAELERRERQGGNGMSAESNGTMPRPGIKALDTLAVDRDESIARLHHFTAFGWTARGEGVNLPRRHHGALTCQGGPCIA